MSRSNSQAAAPRQHRILLIDDHALVRRGLTALIETESDLMICAEAATYQEGLDAITHTRPDLVIADLSLEDSDGLDLVKEIKRTHPLLPVLVLSMYDEAVYAERALRSGARGYVSKRDIDDTILIAIRRLLAGQIHTSEAMSRMFAEKFIRGGAPGKGVGMELLSDRELQVFTLIGGGKTTREIAAMLNLSVKTIESYREHLKVKLDLPSGAGLTRGAILWMETGRIH